MRSHQLGRHHLDQHASGGQKRPPLHWHLCQSYPRMCTTTPVHHEVHAEHGEDREQPVYAAAICICSVRL